MKLRFALGIQAPDLSQRFLFPKAFGKGRAIIGAMDFAANKPNRSVAINLADAAHRRIGRHSAANKEIFVIRHSSSPSITSPMRELYGRRRMRASITDARLFDDLEPTKR